MYFFTWEGPFVNDISLLLLYTMQQPLIHNSFIQKLWRLEIFFMNLQET